MFVIVADRLGNAFRELRNVRLFPSVGMKKQPTVHLVANFGQQPFIFDIDGMVKVCIYYAGLVVCWTLTPAERESIGLFGYQYD